MKKIHVSDLTLCNADFSLGFKEKIAVAKQLDRINVDCIDFGKIMNIKTDPLLIGTVAPLLKNAAVSLTVGFDNKENEIALKTVSYANKPVIKLSAPVSTVGMEYISHKKPAVMLKSIEEVISKCKEKVNNIEFSAEDATRAEPEFLYNAIRTAISAGATTISLCDTSSCMLPFETGKFIKDVISSVPEIKDCCLTYVCPDKMCTSVAASFAAIEAGANGIKTCTLGSGAAPLNAVSELLRTRGDSLGINSSLDFTVVSTSIKQIGCNITSHIPYFTQNNDENEIEDDSIVLDKNDDIKTVSAAVCKLGYDLSADDEAKVFEAFEHLSSRKKVGAKELDAIVATVAMQVPSTYRLISYLTTSGNVISASAHITLEKNGEKKEGITVGDGPIDASFLALEQIIGHHYELDDFQIQSVTEGHEAMGNALVRLRSGGKIYSGNGISTDIIGASILAYINALNKIIYEEAEK